MAEAAVEQPQPPKRKIPPIKGSRCHPFAEVHAMHVVYVEEGTPKETLLDPTFWAMYAPKLTIGDHIYVDEEAGNYFCELKVRSVGINAASVKILRFIEFPESDIGEIETRSGGNHEVKFGNMHTRFRVVRKDDKHVVKDKLQTRAEADIWMRDYEKTLRR